MAEFDEHQPGLPDAAYTTALLALSELGPARLDWLLEEFGTAHAAWIGLREGKAVEVPRTKASTTTAWRSEARSVSVDALWEATKALGVAVSLRGEEHYPERLNHDPEPPRVLFSLGDYVPGPSVAIVGTRACTAYGQRCAFELAAALSAAGVSVVSGLALGIDSAAHQGALSTSGGAPPIGVVGSGLDVVYPHRNRRLWAEVATAGVLFSEAPPGVKPARWRFPARNRIIAGLADAVVVIESHDSGGSLLTADEALARDVPVCVVPGPITSPSATGSNRLLAEGAVPILGIDDVLGVIGHLAPTAPKTKAGASNPDSREASDVELLDAIGWSPVLFEQLCLRTGREVASLAADIEGLVLRGYCERKGPWIERVR